MDNNKYDITTHNGLQLTYPTRASKQIKRKNHKVYQASIFDDILKQPSMSMKSDIYFLLNYEHLKELTELSQEDINKVLEEMKTNGEGFAHIFKNSNVTSEEIFQCIKSRYIATPSDIRNYVSNNFTLQMQKENYNKALEEQNAIKQKLHEKWKSIID